MEGQCHTSGTDPSIMHIYLLLLAKRQDYPSEILVQNLSHGAVDGRGPAEYPLVSGEDGPGALPSKAVTCSEHPEEDGQRQEHDLKAPVGLPRADPHEKREESPHEEIPGHEDFAVFRYAEGLVEGVAL